MSPVPPTDPVDILRYWLLCIRYEEALAARPRAQRPGGISYGDINLRDPVSERMYFKISLDDIALLLEAETRSVVRPLVGELSEFFEAWLGKQYRLSKEEGVGPEMMVMCPAAHLSQGALAGLIRFEVSAAFLNEDGSRFDIPSRSMRRQGALPKPPTHVRIERILPEEGPPLFADPRFLIFELGMLEEEMEELFGAWHKLSVDGCSPADYLALVLTALSASPSTSKNVVELLSRIADETARRMRASRSSPRCYRVGLVVDTSRTRATFYLQKEIEALIRGRETLKNRAVLWSYLRQSPLPMGAMPIQGLQKERAMTRSQKEAASCFLGSKLTAVEGPPGTGKTTLILHLAAHRLVTRIATFVKTGKMPSNITLVCSTNNRAVDNAVDPLARDAKEGGLALGLRAGNRRVCKTTLVADITTALNQLSSHVSQKKENHLRLKKATKQFAEQYGKLKAMLAPQEARAAALYEKQHLEMRVEVMKKTVGEDDLGTLPNAAAVNAALDVLERLAADLHTLSKKCEKRPSTKKLVQVIRYHETATSRLVQKTQKALARVHFLKDIFTAPVTKGMDAVRALSLWENAAEAGMDAAETASRTLEDLRSRIEAAATLCALKNKLAGLHIPEAPDIDEASADRLRHAVFEQAEAVRFAHAAMNAEKYLGVLKAVLDRLENTASLRFLKPDIREYLQSLFPVWGCTLLSLGNIFDDEPESIDEVIIDEAGQCHPAYAVSALFRCRRALVLGDVHQLTPIFGLSEPEERPLRRGLTAAFKDMAEANPHLRVFDKSHTSVQRIAELATSRPLRLTDHFRCQKEIIEISDRLCDYGLAVHTPHRSRKDLVPFLAHPLLFVQVGGEQERQGGSWLNRAELRSVCDMVEEMLLLGIRKEEIAVITPYRAQLLHLRKTLIARHLPVEESAELLEQADEEIVPSLETSGIAVGTVHRFQGGERSIVLFSTVITDNRQLGFLNERANLVNVAVSRAMDHLVVFGHGPTLRQGRLTRTLIQGAVEYSPSDGG